MTGWDKDALLAKSRLFFERAFDQRHDEGILGLWCSLGLELLARAAVSSRSPTLLAEPDPEQRNLLAALDLNIGSGASAPRSIGAAKVIELCTVLFTSFTKDDRTAALALVYRRNEELHTASAAFDAYPAQQWLPGFYRLCFLLTSEMGESLDDLFGRDEAQLATQMLSAKQQGLSTKIEATIAAHKSVFFGKTATEQSKAKEKAVKSTLKLANERHHKVPCPACGADATLQGEPFGQEKIAMSDDEIVVRQGVLPHSFTCEACGLKLNGFAELQAAKLSSTYSRRTTYAPEEYYGLIDPDTADMSPYVDRYLSSMQEYDNE